MSRPITPSELRRYFPKATASALKVNSGVGDPNQTRAPIAEHSPRNALSGAGEKEKSHPGFYFVLIKSYQCNVQDFDNPVAKFHVDALRHCGVLPNDDASICDGRVERVKVRTHDEEKTEIEIYWQPL